ncbi:MAG: lytic transglycosylase domain-containing protein [Acidobacteriota bacterium]
MTAYRSAFVVASIALLTVSPAPRAQEPVAPAAVLSPTNHPRLPLDLSELWLAPPAGRRTRTPLLDELAAAIRLETDGDHARALPIVSKPALRVGTLGLYGDYYKGLAELRLGQAEAARRTFQAMQSREFSGFLVEAAALREAEADQALGDHAAALRIYERLAETRTTAPDDVLMRLGRAAKMSGDGKKADRTFARLYYEYPFSDFAVGAGQELDTGPFITDSVRHKAAMDRAERLFGAKRYGQARGEFLAVRNAAQDDDRERIDLRIAECDYFLKRARIARDALRPYVARARRQGEALFFHAVSSRELGDLDAYRKTIERLSTDFAKETWAEDALNDLATWFIRQDEDEKANETLRELYARFPTGPYAERAAWKTGWWAYKNGSFADTIRVFESAAADFPRSDYRPMWLYWSGRAYEGLNQTAAAEARYALTITDYQNLYYGRLAVKRLAGLGVRPPVRPLVFDARTPPAIALAVSDEPAQPGPASLPPNEAVIRALLALDLYDQAVDELRYAQKIWGDSPPIQATLAWIYVQQGRAASGTEQFSLFRSAINAMKRAYPQYMAAGGEGLPREVLRVIYPIAHWDLIRKYAAENNVDPYLAAALILQESTFVPDIRSPARAVGLTQLMTPTARQYARTLGLRWTPALLTNPEANVRMGMAYFADKIKEFGAVHLALASYNAGERAVRRWIVEHPGVPDDEFIDDISYPETQQYVKKLLGTAEDYRRLYSPDANRPQSDDDEPVRAGARRTVKTPSAVPAKTVKKKAAPPAAAKPATAKPARKRAAPVPVPPRKKTSTAAKTR